MKIKLLKKRNGCSLIQYPSGMYGVEYTDASYGYGMKYTDTKKVAETFFDKVSADTSSVSIRDIRKQKNKAEILSRL